MGQILVDEDQYLELLGRASLADELNEKMEALEKRINLLESPSCKHQKKTVISLLQDIEGGLPLDKIFKLMKLEGKTPSKRTARSKLKRSLITDNRFKLYDHPRTLKLYVKVVTVNR